MSTMDCYLLDAEKNISKSMTRTVGESSNASNVQHCVREPVTVQHVAGTNPLSTSSDTLPSRSVSNLLSPVPVRGM